jgi:hypothetical protein
MVVDEVGKMGIVPKDTVNEAFVKE